MGYAFQDTQRTSVRRAFQYRAANLPLVAQQLRTDYLVSDLSVQQFGIYLLETSAQDGTAAFDAGLRVHAGYAQVDFDPLDWVKINAGVRYEKGRQRVAAIDLFNTGAVGQFNTDRAETAQLVVLPVAGDVGDGQVAEPRAVTGGPARDPARRTHQTAENRAATGRSPPRLP